MYSIGVLSTVLFVVIATTNALQCRPVTCMLACPFGFDVDANGCPHCSCRRTPLVCVEPIFGYNCGSIDHRDCPSTHECQLSFSGFTGQCCLRTTGSTTARTPTGTSTARTSTGTSTARHGTTGTSTRRPMNRLFTFVPQSTTNSQNTGSPVSSTPSYVSGQSAGPASTTQRWFTFDLARLVGVGAK